MKWKKRKNKGNEKMKSTQKVKPEMFSAAQPPIVAGSLFGVRNQKNSVVEIPAGSLALEPRSNESTAEPHILDNFKTPRVKKQCAGLW